MKKILAVLLIAALLLCTGCSKFVVETVDSLAQAPTEAPVITTPAPTEAPVIEPSPEPTAEPEPEVTAEPVSEPEPANTVPGKLLYERTAAVLKELKRGDKVEILEEQGEYCSVKVGDTTGLIKKSLLRTAGSSDYKSWGGYTGFDAVLYKDCKLSSGSMTPYLNTPVTVIDEYDDCYVVTLSNETYYVRSDCVNWFTVHYWVPEEGGSAPAPDSSTPESDDSSSESDSNTPEADNGDNKAEEGGVEETASRGSYALTPLGTVSTRSMIPTLLDDTGTVVNSGVSATVKADGAELILGYIEPGTELRVIERGTSKCTVYYENQIVTLPSCLVKLNSDADYKTWTGYASRFAPCYSSYLLNDAEPQTLVTNSALTILDDLGSCYVISVNGHYRFISHSHVNYSPINYMAGTYNAEDIGGTGGEAGGETGSGDSGDSGDSGNTGSGDGGNTGSGDGGNTGSGDGGNTGSGDSGNTGSGDSGNTGSGDSGGSGSGGSGGGSSDAGSGGGSGDSGNTGSGDGGDSGNAGGIESGGSED